MSPFRSLVWGPPLAHFTFTNALNPVNWMNSTRDSVNWVASVLAISIPLLLLILLILLLILVLLLRNCSGEPLRHESD